MGHPERWHSQREEDEELPAGIMKGQGLGLCYTRGKNPTAEEAKRGKGNVDAAVARHKNEGQDRISPNSTLPKNLIISLCCSNNNP